WITFSEPVNTADLTMFGSNNTTVQDVTLIGAAGGPLTGSLYIDPLNPNQVLFKATEAYLSVINPGGIPDLPDDTYTLTLVSGTGSNGFTDPSGNHLDGAANGGRSNYTATFTTTYQAAGGGSATPVLGIPDFARGPDSSSTITVPNNNATPGIPVTLYNITSSV